MTARYDIDWTAAALREIRKLDKRAAARVLAAISRLAAEPRPPGARHLVGHPPGIMRIRAGDYRIVYQVEDDHILVTVVRVAHRRAVYRDL